MTPSQQAKRQKELEREKKKEAQELRKLEVCFNLYPFHENATLILPQEENRRKELEREEREAEKRREALEHEKKEREARELEENFKARCDPHLF